MKNRNECFENGKKKSGNCSRSKYWIVRVWDRYLEKLNKATGGKPPSCCS